jgi:tetraacyldisaccharide 4'-kinase
VNGLTWSSSHLRAWIARCLEGGRATGLCAASASRAWGAIARVERPLSWRSGARVVVVGGATLGGSGKTPLAVACAEELRRAGARVALVGHAYGASPDQARIVSEQDDVRSVGDEARACARKLAPWGIPVVVAKARQEALDLALGVADVAVVDGPCQTTPRRATLSLLAVDGDAPWGAGHCPPAGDLRAPRAALLAAVDRVVVVGGEVGGSLDLSSVPADSAEVVSRGAWALAPEGYGSLLDWEELRRLRLGVWTAIARPERVLRALSRRGVFPRVAVFGGDHSPRRGHPWARSSNPDASVDLWLTTSKCESHIPRDPGPRDFLARRGSVPVAALDHALSLAPVLTERLRAIAGEVALTPERPAHSLVLA